MFATYTLSPHPLMSQNSPSVDAVGAPVAVPEPPGEPEYAHGLGKLPHPLHVAAGITVPFDAGGTADPVAGCAVLSPHRGSIDLMPLYTQSAPVVPMNAPFTNTRLAALPYKSFEIASRNQMFGPIVPAVTPLAYGTVFPTFANP